LIPAVNVFDWSLTQPAYAVPERPGTTSSRRACSCPWASYRAFLSELLLAECDEREQLRAARRVHEAGFPRPKNLADFDFSANRAIDAASINTLAGCGWVNKLCLRPKPRRSG